MKTKYEDVNPLASRKNGRKGMSMDEYEKATEKPAATERLTTEEQIERVRAFRRRGGWSQVDE